MAGRGGKREGAGRPAGAKTKVGAQLREAAQAFTDDALNTLAQIMRESESDAARVSAANSILDRGYGKPPQALTGDESAEPIRHVFKWES